MPAQALAHSALASSAWAEASTGRHHTALVNLHLDDQIADARETPSTPPGHTNTQSKWYVHALNYPYQDEFLGCAGGTMPIAGGASSCTSPLVVSRHGPAF